MHTHSLTGREEGGGRREGEGGASVVLGADGDADIIRNDGGFMVPDVGVHHNWNQSEQTITKKFLRCNSLRLLIQSNNH